MRGVIGTENVCICRQKNGVIHYVIVKWVDGKRRYLGHATTLIIALMKRDWCKVNGWKPYPQPVTKYIYKNHCGGYEIRKKGVIDGELKCHSLGVYRTLEDAQFERDKLVEVDWDLDAWCNLG